ncbi:uncharacterized protein LOC122089682 [Macadamia integrifolia]|uniref:uncharacterized protein LOC122089682 n=1 Tax=Macadamia integrifolia TaxID=60698 RepID=UPI001C4F7A9A|nr:uncharacterized protein LOC122089682 [Macadamia integrifolia]
MGYFARVLVEIDISEFAVRIDEVQVERFEPGTSKVFGFRQKMVYEDNIDRCGYCRQVGHLVSTCRQKKLDDAKQNAMDNAAAVQGTVYVEDGVNSMGLNSDRVIQNLNENPIHTHISPTNCGTLDKEVVNCGASTKEDLNRNESEKYANDSNTLNQVFSVDKGVSSGSDSESDYGSLSGSSDYDPVSSSLPMEDSSASLVTGAKNRTPIQEARYSSWPRRPISLQGHGRGGASLPHLQLPVQEASREENIVSSLPVADCSRGVVSVVHEVGLIDKEATMREKNTTVKAMGSKQKKKDFIHNTRQSKAPNLWILWKIGLPHPVVSASSDQSISILCDWLGSKIGLSFVHIGSFKVIRRNLWLELGLQVSPLIPWLVIGDFNATLASHEKRGRRAFNLGSTAEFQAMVDGCELLPVPSLGKKFTWSNNRRRGNVRAVQDCTFCNEKRLDFFKNVKQLVLVSSASDHAPLLIASDDIPKPRNSPFRFHSFWMENESFISVVEDAWRSQFGGDPIFILASKLKRVKETLRPWARSTFSNLNDELEKVRLVLKEVQDMIDVAGMTNELFNKEADVKTTLLKASQLHDKMWRFHKASETVVPNDLLKNILRVLEEDDVAVLESVPSRDEINQAVWDLDPASSPGPDGFPGSFFRKCWPIVEDDFCRAVKKFFEAGQLPKGINNCFISLIPKVEGATSLDRFRPYVWGTFSARF